jgi:uncharacterized protein YbjT (DUF2867 family)
MGCSQNPKKRIVVTGATGQQGGAVIRALLANYSEDFEITALVRDPEKAKAKIPAGVEMVKGDLFDLESLKEAFKGAYGVFCVTAFWQLKEGETESTQAKNLAEACKHNNVSHVVWSTLENTRDTLKGEAPVLKGDYYTPHFDGKADANSLFDQAKTTFLHTSFYYENFIYFGMVQKNEHGMAIAFNMGDAPLPMVSVDDIGKAVANIFANKLLMGKNAYISSDVLTCKQIAELMSKHLGSAVNYFNMEDEAYRKLPFPGADDLGNMFVFKRLDANFTKNRKEFSNLLLKNTEKFDDWLGKKKNDILKSLNK